MISGANPNQYGFDVDYTIFSKLNNVIKNGFSSSGNRLFWKEIYEYSVTNSYFYNNNEFLWDKEYKCFFANLQSTLELPLKKITTLNRIKLGIIDTYPKMFNFYLNIRRKFL